MNSAPPPKTYARRCQDRVTPTLARMEDLKQAVHAMKAIEECYKEMDAEISALPVLKSNTDLCELCRLLPVDPFILDCGHIFCFPCVTGHLDAIRESFLRISPDYQPVPPDLLQTLRNPLIDLGKYFIAARQRREDPGPQYACPTCGYILKHRPVRVFDQGALKETLRAPIQSTEIEGAGVVPVTRRLFADYPLL